MTEVIYLHKIDLENLVRKEWHFESVTFSHHEDFLLEEQEGVMIFGERLNGEENNYEYSYIDLYHIVCKYVDDLGFEFRGWRLFTVSQGLSAALLVKRR